MDIVRLSKRSRPGSGETSSKGFTYYWHDKGSPCQGGSHRHFQQTAAVPSVDEHIMQLRLKHSVGFMSAVAV